jgi:hypothetical protein
LFGFIIRGFLLFGIILIRFFIEGLLVIILIIPEHGPPVIRRRLFIFFIRGFLLVRLRLWFRFGFWFGFRFRFRFRFFFRNLLRIFILAIILFRLFLFFFLFLSIQFLQALAIELTCRLAFVLVASSLQQLHIGDASNLFFQDHHVDVLYFSSAYETPELSLEFRFFRAFGRCFVHGIFHFGNIVFEVVHPTHIYFTLSSFGGKFR